jgi:hypothetical protein
MRPPLGPYRRHDQGSLSQDAESPQPSFGHLTTLPRRAGRAQYRGQASLGP